MPRIAGARITPSAGVDGLDLHHLYRAMAWLGEELLEKEQDGRTPFAPRCLKDVIEERLFAHRRDLLTRLDLVFMDTTSLYFEGAGGQTLGQHGYSKDHRPDLRQMILAVLLDGDGRPVCSEMWPGNTADVTTLIPVIDRLRRRFAIARVCVVADRGMISAETVAELEARRLLYILGVRERSDKLVRELVLEDAAPFVPLAINKRGKQTDYEAKTVLLAGRRYIVCRNHQEAKKDAADRASIVAALERQLAKGDKALVGNTGYRRYLKTISDQHFAIDPDKIAEDNKFDGIFVLRTNTDLNPLAAMLCYKQLWTVEQTFRTAKHLLSTRPIFHKLDETIRGHVFCSFLALVLKKALEDRIAALGRSGSWPETIADLNSLTETEIEYDGKRFIVRSPPRPAAGLALRAAGVALPPTVRDATASLTPPHGKCSAKPPARRGLPCLFSCLVNRTVEDGPKTHHQMSRPARAQQGTGVQRFSGVRLDGVRIVPVRPAADALRLGSGQPGRVPGPHRGRPAPRLGVARPPAGPGMSAAEVPTPPCASPRGA